MGKIKGYEVLGGHPEFLLNADYSKDGYHYDQYASYVTTNKFGKKVVVAGTPIPSNDANCIGLALSTYNMEDDDYNASIVVRGIVKESQLPVTLTDACKTALKTSGIIFR